MKLAVLGTALAGALLVTTAPVGAPARAAAPEARDAAVTPGSYLAVVDHGPDARYGGITPRTQSLVLVSPTGTTTTVYSHQVRHHRTFTLNDWSLDGSTALLVTQMREGAELAKVDVATGSVQKLFVTRLDSAVLDRTGGGVLATVWKGPKSNTLVLDQISWSGTVTRLRDKSSGVMLSGPGGTVLTSDSGKGRVQLLVSTTTGAVVNQFRIAGFCTPVRWWDATRVLESCAKGNLYLVDPTTGVSSQLTSTHGRGDYGHMDARQLGSTLYVQVAGACGYTYVARVTSHSTKPLKLHHVVGNVVMVDAVGGHLVLEHAASCDGGRPRSELTTYDPSTGVESPLVRLGKHDVFGEILVLGEDRAITY